MIDEDSITLFIPAWGQKHLDYLRDFALPSVLQSGNLPACGYKKIIVRGSTIGPIEPLAALLIRAFDGLPADIQVRDYGEHHNALIGALKDTIRHCIQARTRMLLVIPDAVIADGGIVNMREHARGKPVSVAAPHLRVDADSFSDDLRGYFKISSRIPSSDLVRMAFSHPHQSLTDSFSDNDNGTLTGGISLTRIRERMTTIIHYLPNVWLAWFTESDFAFFDQAMSICAYDHDWQRHLAADGRLRVVGDSDFFFAAELTDPGANRVVVEPGSRLSETSTAGLVTLEAFVGTLHG